MLIRYVMSSAEKTLEGIRKTNEDLILQLNKRERLLETEWLKRIEADAFDINKSSSSSAEKRHQCEK